MLALTRNVLAKAAKKTVAAAKPAAKKTVAKQYTYTRKNPIRVNVFGMFLIRNRKNAALNALPFSMRSHAVGQMYRKLTPQQLAELKKAASKVTYKPKHLRKKAPRAPSRWTKFVQEQFKSNPQVKKTKNNSQRLKLIGRLYKAKYGKK